MITRSLTRAALLWACAWMFAACLGACLVDAPAGLTEPCAEGCNEDAKVGAPCAKAEDCAQGAACNLGFQGGYCQPPCDEGAREDGDPCGGGQGRCYETGGELGAVCLAECNPTDPASCAHPRAACVAAEATGGGVCLARCGQDADCGSGKACDGQGFCRPVLADCDGLYDVGCINDGLRCYLSPQAGPFCGAPGDATPGGECNNVAGCVADHWCVQGRCLERCDVQDPGGCGGVPSACTPLVVGARLGFCVR